MSECARRNEVVAAVREGRWLREAWAGAAHGDLQQHVKGCRQCAAEVRMLMLFASARKSATEALPALSPELLWWKAQLRRRHHAMEQLQRPAVMISATAIAGSVVLLLAAVVVAWKQMGWARLIALFSPERWDVWVFLPLAALLCAFVVVAVAVASSSLRRQP